ncbi:MAG: molybdate ABC transporter permease subunit [Deltaproteobacteria bacterium]|nr:molybdate ABC transporter permease subunit [Deltaproteobacteria bacterium]
MSLKKRSPAYFPGLALGSLLLLVLVLPLFALLISSSLADLRAGLEHRLFFPALWLSARTTAICLFVVVLTGTPLAWWLARTDKKVARVVELFVDIPIVLPPAVVGVGLLEAFGRNGLLGPSLDVMGVSLPFTTAAVVMAQVVVAGPFYVQSAVASFRKMDSELLMVAQTLGATSTEAFFRIALPASFSGLMGGAALCWARSIGEFGATLLFAGNLSGRTQTMPLAIFTTLESDVRAALALSLVLAGVSILLLFGMRAAPRLWSARTAKKDSAQKTRKRQESA